MTRLPALSLLLACVATSPSLADEGWFESISAISSDGHYELFVSGELYRGYGFGAFCLSRRADPGLPKDASYLYRDRTDTNSLGFEIAPDEDGNLRLRPSPRAAPTALVAHGACVSPLWITCLSAGEGFVLGANTHQWIFERHDGAGRPVWRVGFDDFGPDERCASCAPRWVNFLLDAWTHADRLVVLFHGHADAGLAAFDLRTGSRVALTPDVLARRIRDPDGRGDEDFGAAWAALTSDSLATVEAARATWERPRSPLAQVAVATLLAQHGDEGARKFLRAFLAPPRRNPQIFPDTWRLPGPSRRLQEEVFLAHEFAVAHLPLAFDEREAWALLNQAQRSRSLHSAVSYGYCHLGAKGLAAAVALQGKKTWSLPGPRAGASSLDSPKFWSRHDDARLLERLTDLYGEAPSASRAVIAGALGYYPRDAARPLLLRALEDPDPEVRAVATVELVRLYPDWEATRPLLLRALEDPNPEVRAVATVGRVELDPDCTERYVPELVAALGAEDPYVQGQARGALTQFGRQLAGDGAPGWPAVLAVYRLHAVALGGAFVFWFALIGLLPLPRPRRWRWRAVGTLLVALPPSVVGAWAVFHVAEAPWTEPFLRRGLAEGGLSAPTLAVATLAGACGVLALAVVLGGRRRRA